MDPVLECEVLQVLIQAIREMKADLYRLPPVGATKEEFQVMLDRMFVKVVGEATEKYRAYEAKSHRRKAQAGERDGMTNTTQTIGRSSKSSDDGATIEVITIDSDDDDNSAQGI